MPTVYTQPGFFTVYSDINFDLFNSADDTEIARWQGHHTPDSSSRPPEGVIVGMTLDKITPYDVGGVMLGHGAISAEQGTIGSFTDVEAGTVGTLELNGWRSFFNDLRRLDDPRIFATFEGPSQPSAGAMRLYLHMIAA
ncbi:hypothetical protein [Tranquillimonas rosea]|uniref:hypothetical protein n=1 Tax=Tranquillimonas rosea TaxID=641238 RepID=UPI003BA98D86